MYYEISNEKEYFALIDIMEDLYDDDAILEEKVSRALSKK